MKIVIVCMLFALLSGCSSDSQFNFSPGFYEARHPQEDAIWDALEKSSVTVYLSGHAGISLPTKTGKGWEENLSIEQLRKRIEEVADRRQSTILEGKNFTGENQADKKVIKLLKELGFKTIIVQGSHSRGTLIIKVIRN